MNQPVLQEHLLRPDTRVGAIWRYSQQHPKLFHFHAQLELLVVTRGSLVERIGNTLHRAHARQLVWLLPGLPHELVWASNDLDFRVVHLEPDLIAELGRAGSLGKLTTPRDQLSDDVAFVGWVRAISAWVAGRPVVELARKDFDALLDSWDRTSDESLGALGAAAGLKAGLVAAFRAAASDHDDGRPCSLVELSCCRLLEDPALDRVRLARELDVSEGYLSRCFQTELGTTFQDQRARMRVARFVTHVAREECSFLDAALRAGFGSYSQLHRAFSSEVGMGPRAYLAHGGRNRRALIPA